MIYHSLIPLIAAIASLTLALLVNRAAPKTQVREVFTFLSVMLVFWNLNFFVLYAVPDYEVAFALAHFFRVGALFLPAAIFHLSIVLSAASLSNVRTLLLWIDYSVAIGLTAVNSVDLFVVELRHFAWGYYSIGTPFYDLFSLYVVANFVSAAGLMLYDYRHASNPRMRTQLKFWLLGVIVALPLGATHLLPAYGVPVYPLGNLGSAAWAGIVAYAIVRHRLMDVDVVLTKGIAYLGTGTAILGPSIVVLVSLQSLTFDEVHYDFTAAVVLLILGASVLFPKLQSWTERQIQLALFRQKYEERAAFAAFTKSIVSILDREKLLGALCDTVGSLFRLRQIEIFLTDAETGTLVLASQRGTEQQNCRITREHPFAQWLVSQTGPVLRSEVTESAGTRIVQLWQEHQWEVCVPLASGRRQNGFIGLGRKQDLATFSVGDLDLLSTLAAESAVALENAKLYEELRRSQDVIQRAGRLSALGTLAAGIAHEIRNPLVSIQTFFQLAPKRIHDEEFLTSFLSLTEGEVKRICNLITELLNFAKSPTPSFRYIKLSDEITKTITLLSPQARKQNVTLELSYDETAPTVLGDSDQLRQVMINIILNAIEASEDHSTVRVSLDQSSSGGKQYSRVSISDSGKGMSPDVRENLFNPFFTTKAKGTGLGLAICHQIITEHGGFIEVDSEENTGTTFYISLPVAIGPAIEHMRHEQLLQVSN